MPIEIKGDQAFITCDCGKDITVSNEHGMFCEDMCGYEESLKVSKKIDTLISKLLTKNIMHYFK